MRLSWMSRKVLMKEKYSVHISQSGVHLLGDVYLVEEACRAVQDSVDWVANGLSGVQGASDATAKD